MKVDWKADLKREWREAKAGWKRVSGNVYGFIDDGYVG